MRSGSRAKELLRLGRAVEALAQYRASTPRSLTGRNSGTWHPWPSRARRSAPARGKAWKGTRPRPGPAAFSPAFRPSCARSGDEPLAEREFAAPSSFEADWAPAWASLGPCSSRRSVLPRRRRASRVRCAGSRPAQELEQPRPRSRRPRPPATRLRAPSRGPCDRPVQPSGPSQPGSHCSIAMGKADRRCPCARGLPPRTAPCRGVLFAGDLYRKRRDAANALASYRSAVAIAPRGAKARNALAELLWETGAVEEARREFCGQRARSPRQPEGRPGFRALVAGGV